MSSTNLTREYLSTLPSITKFLFYATLSFTLLLTLLHTSPISYLLPAPLLSTLRLHLGVPSLLFSPSTLTSLPFELHRLLAPFLLYPLPSSPTFLLSVASFLTLLLASRHIEEEHLLHAAGAAHYTSAIAFALTFFLATSTLSSYSSSSPSSPADLPPPPPVYFSSSLFLLFFIATLSTTFAPFSPLASSSLLQQWHSPYLLLLLFCILAPPAFGSAVWGISAAYLYHVATEGVGRVWGMRLWGVPEWLVRLYERWGIGERKIGLQAMEGGVQLGGT